MRGIDEMLEKATYCVRYLYALFGFRLEFSETTATFLYFNFLQDLFLCFKGCF